MAFGTGLHPTTRLTLEALQEWFKPSPPGPSPARGRGGNNVAEPVQTDVAEPSVATPPPSVATQSSPPRPGWKRGQRGEGHTRILDLGTGSGILAMAAARLGADVLALDVSDVAVDVARQNVEANALSDRIEVGLGSIEQTEGQTFDLILANIIASVLIDLAPQLFAALKPGCVVLSSGIIDERAPEVREAFAGAGLEIAEERQDGDWLLLIARRPA